jgi:hypothetical protein
MQPGQETRQNRLNLNHFRAVWEGESEDNYGEQAVTGTLALVLRALGVAQDEPTAYELATVWWRERHQTKLEREAI